MLEEVGGGGPVHDGVLGRSPASRRTAPRTGSQRPYVATTAQIWALHDAMDERYRAGLLLAAFAGLRLAEVCGLRVTDVDFMRGIVHPVVQYPAEELKTETSRRAVLHRMDHVRRGGPADGAVGSAAGVSGRQERR